MLMEMYENKWPNESDPKKQLRNYNRLVDDHYELEKRHLQVLSELKLLKKRMDILKHDLRSPLLGICMMIDLFYVKDKDQIEVKTSSLTIIKESIESLLNLITNSLVYQDSQKNQTKSVNINRNLSSVLTEINRLYLPMAKYKEISLSLRTYIIAKVQLPTDFFLKLIQITGNLVANAVKFTSAGGSIEVVFTLDKNEDQNMLHITVADTGKSMSGEQVAAFNQGKPVRRSTGTNGEKGFGIGLEHVRELVSQDGGHIVVESKKESGTTFSLSFPLSDANLTQISISNFTVKDGTILLNGSQK